MRKYLLLCTLLSGAWKISVAQPYSVNITTTAIPPANAVSSQYITSGKVTSSFMYGAVGLPPLQVYVHGRIECVSPIPFTIAVNPTYTQAGTVTLTPGVPTQLIATQLQGAFGFFNDINLVATGINLSSIKDANNNIKLPAGVYRICFTAKQVDPASGQPGANLSDHNLGCGNFTIQSAQPNNGVIVNTVVIPPVNALLSSFIFTGGIKPNLQYITPGGTTQIKVFGKIERIAPSPFTLALNTNYSQQQPIRLTSGVPVQLSASQVMDAFGNFNDNNVTVSGIGLSELKDGANNIKLPDGNYRICFYAKYIDPATGAVGNNASDPAAGCANFGVCANAAAPQFTQPVNNFNINNTISVINPASPMVFAWTPPVSTCGGQMGVIQYDFEIHELFMGQTITDAINNPLVFIKTQLPSSTFLLDTLLYKDVLQRGKQYVIRVRANAATNAMVQKVDNNGYSRIEAFRYGANAKLSDNPLVTGIDPDKPNSPPAKSSNPPEKSGDNKEPEKDDKEKDNKENDKDDKDDNLPPNVCAGVVAPSNTTDFAGQITELQDKDLPIGKFKLHTENKITKSKDGSYSGYGYIEWTPLVNKIRLRVKFDDIKINTDKAIYDGVVRTTTEAGSYTWTPLATTDDITKAVGLSNDKAYKDVREFINSKAKFINQALGNTPIDMPLGWDNDISGTHVTVAIMAISFAATGTNLNILTGFDVPEANGWLNMAGTNFCINPVGTVMSDGTLYLPNDRDFNLGGGGNNWNFKFKGSSAADTSKGTYVNIKNGKLERVMARAEIAFPQNTMAPEDKDGKMTTGSVISNIQFRFANWNDWMATIEIPHFQLKDTPGLSFHTTKVFYDHSNKEDPSGFKYPLSKDVPANNAFMGLYIEEMKILLPEDFKTFNNSDKRTEFTAGNFVVESAGISADINGKNIIGLGVDKTGEGSMGGFAFSLDNFQIVFEKNTYKKGYLDGNFWLPVSTTALKYTGNLRVEKDTLKYDFLIAPEKDYQFDVWAASVDLEQSSHISLKRDSKGPAVEAIISGKIGFSLSSSPKIALNLLKFDSLGISNRNQVTKKSEFWFHPGTWAFTGLGGGKGAFQMMDPLLQYNGSFAGPNQQGAAYASYNEEPEPWENKDDQMVGGFPVAINGIKPIVNFKSNISVQAGIGFNINVGIGGKDKTIISASAGLSITGEMKFDINGLEKPGVTLKGDVKIDSLKVKGDVGPLKVDGALFFYKENSTFGDGVKGRVEAKFPIAKVEATAQFGSVDGFHYWFIDACASFKKPIPLAGFLGLGGFGGGAYYNMTMVTPEPDVNKLAELSLNADAKDMTPGKSMSGVSYVPQSGVFGLKAAAILTMSSSGETFNAKVTLKAEFLEGKMNKFGLEGQAFFITDYPENKTPTVSAVVDMVYDIPKETFSLNAKIEAKILTAKAHIPISVFAAPQGWYIKVGDPFGERASITFIDKPKEKGSSYEAHLGATAYFIAGTLIQIKLPDLPIEVSSKIQRDPSTVQLLEAMSNTPADGFQLGARVDGNFRASFAILYAQAKAIVGFDLALMHFKQQINCNGSPMGWNDWYAVGQLYAYLSAEVGVHVDVWFYQGDLSLCKIEVAAALQGGLPNPAWAEGSAYVHGELLGGLISVSQNFHVKIGDKCYPAGDPLSDIKIISDYGPQKDGDVYDDPYLVSNVGFGK